MRTTGDADAAGIVCKWMRWSTAPLTYRYIQYTYTYVYNNNHNNIHKKRAGTLLFHLYGLNSCMYFFRLWYYTDITPLIFFFFLSVFLSLSLLMSSTPARFLTHSPETKLRPAWHGMLYGAGGYAFTYPTNFEPTTAVFHSFFSRLPQFFFNNRISIRMGFLLSRLTFDAIDEYGRYLARVSAGWVVGGSTSYSSLGTNCKCITGS